MFATGKLMSLEAQTAEPIAVFKQPEHPTLCTVSVSLISADALVTYTNRFNPEFCSPRRVTSVLVTHAKHGHSPNLPEKCPAGGALPLTLG